MIVSSSCYLEERITTFELPMTHGEEPPQQPRATPELDLYGLFRRPSIERRIALTFKTLIGDCISGNQLLFWGW